MKAAERRHDRKSTLSSLFKRRQSAPRKGKCFTSENALPVLAILPSDSHESSLHPHRLSRQNFLERTPDLQCQTLSPEKTGILMTHPSPSLLLSALHDLPSHWPLHITCSHTFLRWDLHYLVPLTCQNGSSCRPRLIQSLAIVTAKRCLSPLTVSGL